MTRMERDLTQGSVLKNLIRFSLPYLVSYFLQTLYGMADLLIIGQFEGVSSTTAVSVGSQVMHMLTVMIVGLAMGTTVAVSKAVGAKDRRSAEKSIGGTISIFIILAVIMHFFLTRTKTGLYLRSVGESPVTADAAGINITKYKYLATMIGGGISAVGGMVYTMTTAGCVWIEASLSGTGWLAVAIVIFCTWRPLRATWCSILFGALMFMYLRIVVPFFPQELYKILPYVVTIIVLVITSMRNIRDKQPPASLGVNYFREER